MLTHTHTHPFNGPLSGTTQVSRYQKGKTNLDFTEARDSEWQWHPLGHMQVCTSFQSDNHASIPPLSFFTGRMPFLSPNQQCQSTEGQYVKSWENSTWTSYRYVHPSRPSEQQQRKNAVQSRSGCVYYDVALSCRRQPFFSQPQWTWGHRDLKREVNCHISTQRFDPWSETLAQ